MGDSPNTPAVSTLSHLAEGPLAARGVDIYFIARPSGNADGAWTTNENPTSHWLRDWLPADLPSTRILTYGYSASPDYDWNIPKIADQLLTDLIGLRSGKLERHLSRPIIFVCQSLGGFVVKCALSKAFSNRGNEAFDDIVGATKGIIFLGTPHTTSTSELSIILSRISIGSDLSKVNMVALSMRQIALQFLNLPWGILPWKIVSFHEALPLPGTNVLAVERIQTKLWKFPQVSLNKNHYDMCWFPSDNDPSYVKVLESLRHIILASKDADQTAAPQNRSQQEHEVLKSLASEDTSIYIPDPHHATLDWIFGHGSTIKSWLEKGSGLYWVHGKPGSGKSTLMKYIANNIISHRPRERVETHTLFTYFFFSQHGANQSVGSLVKSLLYQLLSSSPTYPSPEIFARLAETREMIGTDKPWGNEELTESLFYFVEKSTARGVSLYVVIDALDECDDHDSLVSLLERLDMSSYPQRTIWTCVSSRYSPSSISFVPAWEMRLEDHNSSDIKNYVGAKLLEWPQLYDSIWDAQELAQIIMERGEGVFLWVVLVVPHLLEISYRKPAKDARQLMDWLLPTDLGEAFETVMGRMEGSHDGLRGRSARNALSLVLHAWRPLSALELLDALAASDGMHGYQQAIGITQQDAAAQLCSLGGGFLASSSPVAKPGRSMKMAFEPTVQLVHKSVRQYLLDNDTEGESHFQYAQTCFNYVYRSSGPLQSSTSGYFRGYAMTYGMGHLSMAGKMGLTPKAEDIRRSPSFQEGFIVHWTHLHKQHFNTQNLFKPGKSTAAHVMAYSGIPWFDTELWGVCHTDIDAQDHFGRTPLSVAAAMGHDEICRVLISRGANVCHQDTIYGQTPLHLAAAHGHWAVMEFLLEHGADPNPKTGGSALMMATRGGSSKIARLLLDAGADPEVADTHTGETPLSKAAALGHIPLVSLLLQSGAKVDNWDERGWTPLHHAVKHGRKKTIEVLLRTLTQPQIHRLRVNMAKAAHSWVSTVLQAILVCLGLRQCGQSQAPASDSPHESKTPTSPANHQASATSDYQPGKHKLDPDSEEDDCEDKDQGSHKKLCPEGPSGRRFACPYYKNNSTKYATGTCNRTGFKDIYRVKSHIKTVHNGILQWERCPTCKDRFRPDEFGGHEPCVQRDEPIDYDEGFDLKQYFILTSKAMFPKHSTPEKCWYAMFEVLFPDWPVGKVIPDPYQEGQVQKVSAQELMRVTRDTFTRPETIHEIVINAGRGEQALQQILHRLFRELNSNLGLPPITESQQPAGVPGPTSLLVSRPLTSAHRNMSPAENIPPSASQMAPNRLNMEGSYVQMPDDQLWTNNSYLPASEWTTPFTAASSIGFNDCSSFNCQATSSSEAPSSDSIYQSIHNASEAMTDNTDFSDYDATGHRRWSMNTGINPLQLSPQAAGPSASQQQQPQLYTRPAASSTIVDFSTASITSRVGGGGSYHDTAALGYIGLPTAGAGGDSAEKNTIADPSLAGPNYGQYVADR